MDMVDNEEPRMEEDGSRDDPLCRWVDRASDKTTTYYQTYEPNPEGVQLTGAMPTLGLAH